MSTVQSLKDSGLKATLPRRKILELFEGSKVRHLCSAEALQGADREGIDVGLATVYRVLTQFEACGVLHRGQHFETGKACSSSTRADTTTICCACSAGRWRVLRPGHREAPGGCRASGRGFAHNGHRLPVRGLHQEELPPPSGLALVEQLRGVPARGDLRAAEPSSQIGDGARRDTGG